MWCGLRERGEVAYPGHDQDVVVPPEATALEVFTVEAKGEEEA